MLIVSIIYNLLMSSVGCIVYMISLSIYVKYNFNLTIDIRDSEVITFMSIIIFIIFIVLERCNKRYISWYIKLIKG